MIEKSAHWLFIFFVSAWIFAGCATLKTFEQKQQTGLYSSTEKLFSAFNQTESWVTTVHDLIRLGFPINKCAPLSGGKISVTNMFCITGIDGFIQFASLDVLRMLFPDFSLERDPDERIKQFFFLEKYLFVFIPHDNPKEVIKTLNLGAYRYEVKRESGHRNTFVKFVVNLDTGLLVYRGAGGKEVDVETVKKMLGIDFDTVLRLKKEISLP